MESGRKYIDVSSPATVATARYNISGTVVVMPLPDNSTTAMSADLYLSELNMQFANIVFPAVVVLGVLMFVGAVGNAAVLYVYTCRARRKGQQGGTVTRFIQALALVDLLSCCIAIPGEILDITNNFTFGRNPMCKLVRTVSLFCTLTSGITLIVVAIDRYKRICAPLKRQISPRGAAIILGIASTVALVFSSPNLVVIGAKTVYTDIPTITGADCTISDKLSGTSLPLLYSGMQMLLFVIGFFILLILYILIARRIFHHAHQRLQRRQSIHLGTRLLQPSTPSDVIVSSSSPSSVLTPLTPPPANQQVPQSEEVKGSLKESRTSTKLSPPEGPHKIELGKFEQSVKVTGSNSQLDVLSNDIQNKVSSKSEPITYQVSENSFQPLSIAHVENNEQEVSYDRCSKSFTSPIFDADYRDGDSGFSTDSSPVCPKFAAARPLLYQAEQNGDIVDFSQTMPDSLTLKVEERNNTNVGNENSLEQSTLVKNSCQMNIASNLNRRGSSSLPLILNTDPFTPSHERTFSERTRGRQRATAMPKVFVRVSEKNVSGYMPLQNNDRKGHKNSKEETSNCENIIQPDALMVENGLPRCDIQQPNKTIEGENHHVENTAPPKSLDFIRRSLKEKLASSTHNLLGKLLSSESTGSEWDATYEISLSTSDHEMEVLSIKSERPRSSKRKRSKAEDQPLTKEQVVPRKIDPRGESPHDVSGHTEETAANGAASKEEEVLELPAGRSGEGQTELGNRVLIATATEPLNNPTKTHIIKESNEAEKDAQIYNSELDNKSIDVICRRHSFSYGECLEEGGIDVRENNTTGHVGDSDQVDIVQDSSVGSKEGRNGANKKVAFTRRKSSSFNSADIKGWSLMRNDKELSPVQSKRRPSKEGTDLLSHKPRVSLRERRRGSSFRTIKELSLRRLTLRNDNAGTRRTTLILFLISLVYIISFLPHLAMMLVKSLHPESLSGDGQVWIVASNLIIRSYFINSVANPFIYTFLSKGFARRLKGSLIRRWKQRSTRT